MGVETRLWVDVSHKGVYTPLATNSIELTSRGSRRMGHCPGGERFETFSIT
jgi:hypothetical protein